MSRPTPRPAVRKGQKARVGLGGPSGSGKTWTALELASVLAGEGGTILVFDTERGSASLYADYFTFEVIDWEPPYDPRELASMVGEHGPSYDVLVIDSSSHFWEGEGGTRDIVDAAAARAKGNTYAGWKEGTPAQNDLYAALLQAPCHVIVTYRSKTEYVLEDRNGKQVPRKIGMAPIQRPGIEYEFTVTADLDYEHTLLIDKTRCHPLAGGMFKMGHTAQMAETLRDWLGTAEPMATREDVEAIVAMFAEITDPAQRKQAKDEFVECFGMPQGLTAEFATDAKVWLGDRLELLAEIEDTKEGAGDDGLVSGGDAGDVHEASASEGVETSEGADSHDAGRSGPEPAPHDSNGAGPASSGPAPDLGEVPIDARRLGIRAGKVFEAAIDPESIPARKKTWLLEALRHALIYAVTDGAKASAKDADGEELFLAWAQLGDIEAGATTVTFNARPTGAASFHWADGTTTSVSWSDLTIVEAEAEADRRGAA